MREKLEIRKNEKKVFFKNSVFSEIINTKSKAAIYRVFENEMFGIVYCDDDSSDDYNYEKASQNMKYTYTHTTKLNTQSNIIAKKSNLKDRQAHDMCNEIADEISQDFEYINLSVGYTLSNVNKLHMNFEDERNIFIIKSQEDEIVLKYRNFDVENVIKDIKKYLNANKKIISIKDVQTKNLIVASSVNIYDFFEHILSCQNVMENKLIDNKLFSSNVSLYTSLAPDDTKCYKYGILPFFDWEGSVNPFYKSILIEQGVIVKAYSNKDMAKKYNVENTCSSYAIKEDYPSCKLLGAYLQEGEKNLSDIIDSAVFIKDADVIFENNSISFDVKTSYLYENANLISKIRPFSFNVDAFSMFSDKFVDVSKDRLFNTDLDRAIVFENIDFI